MTAYIPEIGGKVFMISGLPGVASFGLLSHPCSITS